MKTQIRRREKKLIKKVIAALLVLYVVSIQSLSVFATETTDGAWMEPEFQNDVDTNIVQGGQLENADTDSIEAIAPEIDSEIDPETGEYILHDQSGYEENSFRYEGGEYLGLGGDMLRSRSSNDEKAWQKIDGICYNDYGEVVEGAVAKAIDVSEHNKKIDWQQVKDSGIDFVILRVGYGNDLQRQDDKWWQYNVSECTRLGIPFGVYIYSYARNIREAESEADHVLRLIKGYNLSYPVWYDIEDNSVAAIGSAGIRSNAITFCNKIKAAGYEVGVYSGLYFWNQYLSDSVYNNWHRWVAQYNHYCDYKGNYEMWQCTSDGSVPGIEGRVDLNFYYGQKPLAEKKVSTISYRSHIQNIGWQPYCDSGQLSGTSNQSLRMEALELQLSSTEYSGGISYRTHVQNIGWQEAVSDGRMAGTIGKDLRMEAVQISLTGDIANYYDIYYQVHVQDFGWLGWAKNNEVAGTVNYGYRLEAIRIMLVRKGENAPTPLGDASRIRESQVAYTTHVQNIGWQQVYYNGQMAGTTGESLRLEALKLSLSNQMYDGSIVYSTHIQNIGWQQEVHNGQISGTTGQSLRLEAIRIRLTGDVEKYFDVYYRVHIQDLGWLGWTKNGDSAGSEGYSYRMEAMEIKVLPKGSAEAPDTTGIAFYKK